MHQLLETSSRVIPNRSVYTLITHPYNCDGHRYIPWLKYPWLHPNGKGQGFHHELYLILIIIMICIGSLFIQVFQVPYLSFQYTFSEKDWKQEMFQKHICSPPMMQNSGLSSLKNQNLSKASTRKGIKDTDNSLGSKELFDLDLWTCDLKINRDHLLIKGNPWTKSDSCKRICPFFQEN